MKLAVKRTETENLFEILANKAPVGIYIVQDGRFCYTNSAFQSVTGYREDELLGRDSLELVIPEDREMVRENVIKMLKGELTSPCQFRVARKDGGIRWVVETVVSFQYRGRQATLGYFIDITEHKKMEEALRQSEERYRTILEEMEEGYYEEGLEGKFTFVNDAMCRILGYSRDELIGMHYNTYTPKEHIKTILEGYDYMHRTGQPLKWYPMVAVRKDGTQLFVEDSILPLRNQKGGIIGFRGVSRDVTERKQTEEALQTEKNKLQSLIDAMEDHLTIRDRDYNLIYLSERVKKTWGDHIGEKCYRVFEGQDKVCDGCPAEKVFKDGKSCTSERRTVLPSGEVAFRETTASPIRDAQGRIVACLEIARDITERKKMEEMLDIQKAYFQQLFDNSPDAILMMDTDERMIQINRGFKTLFGYSPEEIKGQHIKELIIPENCVHELAEKIQAILEGKSFRKETVRRDKNGNLVDVSLLAYPISFDGKVVGAYVIYTNITERKQMEESLKLAAARGTIKRCGNS
jgi:PAS domain S-box-containing protein